MVLYDRRAFLLVVDSSPHITLYVQDVIRGNISRIVVGAPHKMWNTRLANKILYTFALVANGALTLFRNAVIQKRFD